MKDILTTKEVAKICKVTMTTIANWCDDGSLKHYRTKGSYYLKGHRRIKSKDLLRFIKKYKLEVL